MLIYGEQCGTHHKRPTMCGAEIKHLDTPLASDICYLFGVFVVCVIWALLTAPVPSGLESLRKIALHYH